MNSLKPILGIVRTPFLVLTPACVLLGLGTALWTTGQVNWLDFALVLIGAVAAHASVNAFNEYFDFKTGLDSRTARTPFSGGSGTLPASPHLARLALTVALVTFVLAGLVGLYFVVVAGRWSLLPLGILGLFLVFAYTLWLVYNPVLCLLAPGLGFGTAMVMGTHVALTGHYSWTAFIASLIPFFLVSNLLLLNQFPDVEADRSVGRKHWPIVVGRHTSSLIYGAFLLFAYLAIIVGVYLGYLPVTSLIGLITLALAVPAFRGAVRYADEIRQLVPSLGQNVLINLITPVLVAIGLFIG